MSLTNSLKKAGQAIGAFILLVAGFGFSLWIAYDMYYAYVSRSWPVTSGEIIHIEERKQRSGGTSPIMTFQYRVNEQQYKSRNIAFGYNEHNGRYPAREALRKAYPVGKQVNVFYNPKYPEMSVLRPGEYQWINLIFLTFPWACFFFSRRLWRQAKGEFVEPIDY